MEQVLNNKKNKSINIFVFLFLITVISAMYYNAYDMLPLQYLSYTVELLLIIYTFVSSKINYHNKYLASTVLIISIILLFNYIISPNKPNYIDLLKFLGYYGCYRYGAYLASEYDSLRVNKLWLYSIVLFPVILVAFVDDTVKKDMFFPASNVFVYLGVGIGALYLLVNEEVKKTFVIAIIISAVYILVCTSLGVVFAAFLSFLILNFKKSHLPYLIIGGIIFIISILYIDIPLFIRMRDVIAVWEYVFDNGITINNVDYDELNNLERMGARNDVSSSVWRFSQWTRLFIAYVSEIWTIPFGLGAGFAVKQTGLYPHNDYLLILTEYGLIVFMCIIKGVLRIYKRLKNEKMFIYFILTMLLYHLTENLLTYFPAEAFLFFLIGWCLYNYKKKQKMQV